MTNRPCKLLRHALNPFLKLLINAPYRFKCHNNFFFNSKRFSQFFLTLYEKHELTTYFSLNRQADLLRHYHELMSIGYSQSLALSLLSYQFKASYIQQIQRICEQGQPLSLAFEQLNFDERVIYFIKSHEAKHFPLVGIQKSVDYLEQRQRLQKQFKKELRYPLQLLVLCAIALMAFVYFFLPQLNSFYSSMNLQMNTTTFDLIIMILTGLMTLLSGCFLIFFWLLKRKAQFLLSSSCCRFLQPFFSYYYGMQWQLFLSCGQSFKETLNNMKQFEKNTLILLGLDTLLQPLENGQSLQAVINTSNLFTPYFKQIVCHGLELGQLDVLLNRFLTQQTIIMQRYISAFLKGLQTSALLFVGTLIILIYLSILQPVFDLLQLIN